MSLEEFIFVKSSVIHGKGIFAAKDISKGKKILRINGEAIDGDECERREEEENNVYIFWNGDDDYIDTSMTDKIKYINHNCDFNCDVIDDEHKGLMLVAFKDIKAGEELTIDYGYEDIYNDCGCNICTREERLSPLETGSNNSVFNPG